MAKKANDGSELIEKYELVKVDSFQVNNFTRVVIRDYSPEERLYLGYASNEDDILEISENGKIISRVHKKGDGPGSYGDRNPVGLTFGPNMTRIVELPFRVLIYDQKYNVQHDFNVMSPLPIRTSMPLGKTPWYQLEDTTFLLVGPGNYLSSSLLIQNQLGKDTLQNFTQINVSTGAAKSVIPYSPSSVYKQSDGVFSGVMGKSFFVDNEANELVVVQNIDSQIQQYNLQDLSVKNSIPIKHSEFLSYAPVPIETAFGDERAKTLEKLAGRNHKLINLGNKTYILVYFMGVTQAEFDNRTTEESTYYPLNDASEQRILIIKDGKQLPVELPGINGTMVTGLPNRKVLVQEPENKEVEEEFTRFSIYQLQSN